MMNSISTQYELVKQNKLDMIKFITERGVGYFDYNDVREAAAQGYLDLVRYFYQIGIEPFDNMALDHAAKNGHQDVVKFIDQHRFYKILDNYHEMYTFQDVAKAGHLEVLKYLYCDDYIQRTKLSRDQVMMEALKSAILGKQLNIIKFLVETESNSRLTHERLHFLFNYARTFYPDGYPNGHEIIDYLASLQSA